MNGKIAWKVYMWLCHREMIWNHRHGYSPFVVSVEENLEGGLTVVYEETVNPPPCVWTRAKELMYRLGFIPF